MRWPRGLQGGLTVDLEQLEIIYAQQWSSVASEIEATELHCTKPTAGGDEDTAHGGRCLRRLLICLLAGSWIDFGLEMIWSGTFEYPRRIETIPPLPSIKKIMHKARRKSR